MNKVYMTHSGYELDEAVTKFQESLVPTGTLPAQVILHANCNPVTPKVILTWQYRDNNAEGIVIRRKKDSEPLNAFDGEAVCDIRETLTTSFEDTNFISSEVGTIDDPSVYYYRAFPYNSNRQYQTQYQTSIELGMDIIGVYYLPEGSVAGDIVDSTLLKMAFKFGRWGTSDANAKDLVWEVDHIDRVNGKMYCLLHDAPTGNCMYDANEPGWTDNSRPTNGNSRWSFAGLRQFFNATSNKGEWYQKAHDLDVAPNYAASWPGFLYYFTAAERNLIIPREHICFVPTVDGGGTESVTDLVWAPSTRDMGLENTIEGDFAFSAFQSNNDRKWTYNYWTSTIYQHNSPTHLWGVSSAGALVNHYGNNGASFTSYYAPRAGLVLPLSALLQYNVEEEMYHIITANI